LKERKKTKETGRYLLSFRVFISKTFPLWRRFPGVSKGDGNLLEGGHEGKNKATGCYLWIMGL
jgi:hypothetical protein